MYRLIFLVIGSVIAREEPDLPDPASPPHEQPKQRTMILNITNTPVTFSIAPSPSRILIESHEINPDGSYQWSYETSNGISAAEKGTPLKISEASIGVTGSFKYESLEGPTISLSYVADENGFRPVGNHLPVAPPIPPLIARALEWIASHPEKKE